MEDVAAAGEMSMWQGPRRLAARFGRPVSLLIAAALPLRVRMP